MSFLRRLTGHSDRARKGAFGLLVIIGAFGLVVVCRRWATVDTVDIRQSAAHSMKATAEAPALLVSRFGDPVPEGHANSQITESRTLPQPSLDGESPTSDKVPPEKWEPERDIVVEGETFRILKNGTGRIMLGPNDWIRSTYSEIEGRREGANAVYYLNGQTQAIGEWSKGKRDGEWMYYHPNGRLLEHGSYQAGIREGAWRAWRSDGTPEWLGSFAWGKRVGEWVFYRSSGAIDENLSGLYVDGKRTD